ncbi:MAG: porin family protein [Saprospiraceae bacterium]
MKKVIIVVIALLMANLGFSQTSIGLKAGFTSSGISNLEDSEFAEYKRGTGILIGLIGEFGVNENLSVVAELNLQQKGNKSTSEFDFFGISTNSEVKSTFNFIEVPVLLRFTTGEDLRFYGNVGPYLAYAVGGKVKSEITVAGETESGDGKIMFGDEPENYMGDDFYVDDTFNRLDLGVYVGAGVQAPMGPGALIVDARFGLSLTDSNNLENEPDGYEPNKFNNFTISVGYMIPIGGE